MQRSLMSTAEKPTLIHSPMVVQQLTTMAILRHHPTQRRSSQLAGVAVELKPYQPSLTD